MPQYGQSASPRDSIGKYTRGCVFQSRCQKAESGRCDVEAPELTELVPGSHHRVACFHPEGLDAHAPRSSERPSVPALPPAEG